MPGMAHTAPSSSIRKFHKFEGTQRKKERECMYAKVLVEEWARLAEEKGERQHAVEGTSMRHSMYGKCARQIHYYLTLGYDGITNPMDLPGYWSTGLGTAVHEWWEVALKRAFPTAKVEVVCHIDEADSSGHADAFIEDETKTCLELKTINGFGFKKLAENGDPPRYSDFVQLMMNAYALDADEAVLIYLSLEAVSKNRAKQKGLYDHERITKEFHFGREEIQEVAAVELQRLAQIREAGDATPRSIPDPEYVPGALVADPSNGKMEVGGKVVGYAWQCGYCSYQDRCIKDCTDA